MEPSFVEAIPHTGYLTHAVRADQPELFHRTAPFIVVTYRRALCGVGTGGMRVRLDRETGEMKPWVGVDGCDRCHVKVSKIKRGVENS